MIRIKTRIVVALIILLLLPISLNTSAQFETQSWELGWVTDVDGSYEVEMEDDWDISGTLVIFIENSRQSELNVNLVLDWDSENPFEVEGPESGTIAGGENTSFTFTLTENSALDIRSFSPSDSYSLILTAEEVISDQTVSSQEIDAEIMLPKIFNLQPDDVEGQTMYSDTWIEVEVLISNWGNHKDAVTSADINIRSCPNLNVEGLEQFDNLIVEPTDLDNNTAKGFDVKFIASASHPGRTCEVTFSVTSEGDTRVRSTTFDVKVTAAEIVDNDQSSDGGSSSSDGLSENSSDLSWIGFYELFFILILAFYYPKRGE
ncbi:MAG: hypothetical protein HOL72_04025 [Euryarchaeota archaeon]|jgi:hypothetical protein|nr:hypothetical protein [Euryarchaeota archaeon]MBT5254913.1 hypothetical protein [Euryarchaeota archaeon]MDG1545794.1 hypothetical protein [Candidatus Poseidoniaceae archaeon]